MMTGERNRLLNRRAVLTAAGGAFLAAGGSWALLDRPGRAARSIRVLPHTLGAFTSAAAAVAFSPDGQWLAAGSEDHGDIVIWNMHNLPAAHRHCTGDPSSPLTVLAFSPDSRTLAAVYAFIKFFDVETGHQAGYTLSTNSGTAVAAYGPDGKTMAGGSFDGSVLVWDIPSGRVTRQVGQLGGQVTAIVFSPSGNVLAACAQETVLIRSPAGTAQIAASMNPPTSNTFLAFRPDSQILASGGGDVDDGLPSRIDLWRIPDGRPAGTLQARAVNVSSAVFSADGKSLIIGAGSDLTATPPSTASTVIQAPDGGTIRQISLASGKTLGLIPDPYHGHPLPDYHQGNAYGINDLAMNPDGTALAAAGSDGKVRLYELTSSVITK